MSQFPGFAPLGSAGDVGEPYADCEGDGQSTSNGHNTAVSRTADKFRAGLKISPAKLSIPNPLANYFAISKVVDPKFSPPAGLTASDTSSSGTAPAVLPMTPIYASAQAPAAPSAPVPRPSSSFAQPHPPKQSQADTPSPKPAARKKVPLEKGYSQMVWLKLTRTKTDLAGLKGESPRRLLTMDDIKKHGTVGDAWTVLRGRVYNITPYLKFHPGGGDILMKAAGRDGTALFNKYHAWVNAEFLLEKCLVGLLDQTEHDK